MMLKLLLNLRQFFLLLLWYFLPFPATFALCRQDLAPALTSVVERPQLARSHWGIQIQLLNSTVPLYRLNADKFFIPASNTKLLSSAAALLELTPDFRFRTSLYATGSPPSLTELRLVAGGDPSLTSQQLEQVARQLFNQGVRRIGQLVVQAPPFSSINPTWEWEDIFFGYGVNTHPLILNENTVKLTLFPQELGQPLKPVWSDAIAARQWSITNLTITTNNPNNNFVNIEGILGEYRLVITGQISNNKSPQSWQIRVIDPNNYFLESWQEALKKESIRVGNAKLITSENLDKFGKEFLSIESADLEDLLKKVNQDSNNLYAESLGMSPEKIQSQLTNLGVNPGGYKLVDASGLSRHNLVTPETLVQTLILMQATPYAEAYQESLAVAGEKGTLETRFKDTPVEGKLLAKTGTLSGVIALSGYLETEDEQIIVFSIIVNNSEQSAAMIRNSIDEIILILAASEEC